MNNDALTWFEIPTVDLDRARRFYEDVLHTNMQEFPGGQDPIVMFPFVGEGVGGALVKRPHSQPSPCGTMVYLKLPVFAGEVGEAEARVEKAGGSVVVPKMSVPGVPGEMFVMKDTEGNMVGVHGL